MSAAHHRVAKVQELLLLSARLAEMEKQIQVLTSLLSGVLARSLGPDRVPHDDAVAKGAAQSTGPSEEAAANASVEEMDVDSSPEASPAQEAQSTSGPDGLSSYGSLDAALTA